VLDETRRDSQKGGESRHKGTREVSCAFGKRQEGGTVQKVLKKREVNLDKQGDATMGRKGIAVALLVGTLAIGAAVAMAHEEVLVLDDCDPVTWDTPGVDGCAIEDGHVTRAEFNALLPPGHPAWRLEPAYLKIEPDKTVRATNEGGRNHTFTEVPAFGGGRVPALNAPLGLTPLPQCAANVAPILAPGTSVEVSGLSVGNHLFQCCIHPWMHMLIKVLPED
jgi:plastocyanin